MKRGKLMAGGLGLLTALLVSTIACTVGPDYVPPNPELPETFERLDIETTEKSWTATSTAGQRDAAEGIALLAGEPEVQWWRQLGDPVLSDLVARAHDANLDLRIAEANLAQARALLGIDRWDRYPSATAEAAVEELESSGANLPPGIDRSLTYYSAGLDASWEIDLFGRVRRRIEAGGAEYEARLADRRAVVVAVAGEVGRTYMELRGAQRRLRVARSNVTNQEESLELVQALLEAGRGSELELAQARAQVATTLASLPHLEFLVAQAVHRLSVLVGEPPGALRSLLEADATLPPVPDRIVVGDTAGLLRRRPDIAAAERRLAASTARIGVATADLFPRLSLSGSFGYLATSLDDLGDERARTTSFGPFLSWAAFDLGRVRQRIRANEAGAEAALGDYEKAVLVALEEAENALVRLQRARQSQAHLRRAEEAAKEAAELAQIRYEHGLDSFLTVLDAEARRLAAEDALALGATETGSAFVALYEALGGGWQMGGATTSDQSADACGRHHHVEERTITCPLSAATDQDFR